MHIQIAAALIIASVACDADVGERTDVDRQPTGKADLVGSCATADGDACGGPSDGNCWCDDLCDDYGDCCADKASVCDGLPACQAEEHVCATECVSNLSLESCGQSCDACAEVPYSVATCDGTACGFECKVGLARDSDRCTATSPRRIAFTHSRSECTRPSLGLDREQGPVGRLHVGYKRLNYSTSTGGVTSADFRHVVSGTEDFTTTDVMHLWEHEALKSHSIAFDHQGAFKLAWDAGSFLRYLGQSPAIDDNLSAALHGFNNVSLAIGKNGIAQVVYVDRSDSLLKHARWTGPVHGWDITTVGPGATDLVLALDADDTPHIAFTHLSYPNYDPVVHLRMAVLGDSGWEVETIMTFDGHPWADSPALAIDASGQPHLAYQMGLGSYDLAYATRDADGWRVETLHTYGNVGYNPDIEVDELGRPHISYYGEGSMWLARLVDAEWDVQPIGSGGWQNQYSTILIDGDVTHIAWCKDRNPNAQTPSQPYSELWHVAVPTF